MLSRSGSSAWLPSVASEAQLKAFEKERRRRSIALRLSEAETNYDALFARREREQASKSLSTDALRRGVNKYGKGAWLAILNDGEFLFARKRTAVDLKDKYRNLNA